MLSDFRMLSDLKRRIVAKERVTSQLAASSILPKSIWGRILNERPVVSGRLEQRARRGVFINPQLISGLQLPVDMVRHIVEGLYKRIMDAWIAKRSEGRIVIPQSMHDVNPSSWGHWMWRNMVRDGPSHLIVPRKRWQPEGGLNGGPYWWATETLREVQGPWGLTAPQTGNVNSQQVVIWDRL